MNHAFITILHLIKISDDEISKNEIGLTSNPVAPLPHCLEVEVLKTSELQGINDAAIGNVGNESAESN